MKGRRPYQPSMRVSRRAGCHESGLSGSREAERSKSHLLNPVLLSHGCRPRLDGIESGRPRKTPSYSEPRQTKRVGEAAFLPKMGEGANASRIPLMGLGPKH